MRQGELGMGGVDEERAIIGRYWQTKLTVQCSSFLQSTMNVANIFRDTFSL